jgi:hypothetical protein
LPNFSLDSSDHFCLVNIPVATLAAGAPGTLADDGRDVPANACDVDPGQQFDADSQPSGADGALPCSVMLPAPVSPGTKGTLLDSAGPGPLDALPRPGAELVQAASASAPSNTADITFV